MDADRQVLVPESTRGVVCPYLAEYHCSDTGRMTGTLLPGCAPVPESRADGSGGLEMHSGTLWGAQAGGSGEVLLHSLSKLILEPPAPSLQNTALWLSELRTLSVVTSCGLNVSKKREEQTFLVVM